MINTHGVKIDFGKHNGKLITRVPVSYIKFMINSGTQQSELAKAELERRGDTTPKTEISGHALDMASLRVLSVWRRHKVNSEGLYSWLQKITLEAIRFGEKKEEEVYIYKGLKLVIIVGEEYPVLKTIMKYNKV